MSGGTVAEQTAKLPKWAQAHIADCERRCEDAESKLKDYLDSQSPSLIYTRSGMSEKSFIQSDRVCFDVTNGEITVAFRDGKLECHASYRGGERLLVIPRVTNVIWLEIETYK